jgi:hypothetical protein
VRIAFFVDEYPVFAEIKSRYHFIDLGFRTKFPETSPRLRTVLRPETHALGQITSINWPFVLHLSLRGSRPCATSTIEISPLFATKDSFVHAASFPGIPARRFGSRP